MGIKSKEMFVYGLVDPTNQQLRYIGLSSNGLDRPNSHFRVSQLAKDTNLHKRRWIENLLKQNLKPEIVILERCNNREELAEAEVFQIQYYRSIGANLVNLAAGGDLGNTVPRSAETRQKMSASKVKQWAENKEYKQKMANMFKEYWAKPESRELQRQLWTPERREKSRQRYSKGTFILVETGEVFSSAAMLAKGLGCCTGAIHAALKVNKTSVRGKEFKFIPKSLA